MHGIRALASHALLSRLVPALVAPLLRFRCSRLGLNSHQPLGLGLSKFAACLLQWAGYPIAIYSIAASEKQITETTSLREDLGVMETEVQEGARVKDVDGLSAESWKHIPWALLRD